MAKPKNSRSEFLSSLMKCMGGDAGISVISAYSRGDVEKFKEAMSNVSDILVSGMIKKAKFSTMLLPKN